MINLFDKETRRYIGSRDLPLQPGEDFLYSENEITGTTDGLCLDVEGNYYYDPIEQPVIVPVLISRMGLKIQLRIRNIDISEVEKTIRELPDWMMSPLEKDLAVIKFNDAAYYDRYNADYNLVATMMGLSQTDLDEIHIDGNKL